MEAEERLYKEITERRNKVLEELRPLEESEIVQRYLSLVEQDQELAEEQRETYVKMKNRNYKECSHLTIFTKFYSDLCDGKTYHDIGCIKCGVDTSIYDYERKNLAPDKQAMYDYLKSYSNVLFNSKPIAECDLDLGVAIYNKIKEKHPGIDDKTAKKYFEIALDNIRNIPVSEERKNRRAKRLGLRREFYKWNPIDIRIGC